jgi:putative transposase
MSFRFKGKYRTESTRLQGWDYGCGDAINRVFTICTRNRICFFDDVIDGKMVLNDNCEIACDCRLTIPKIFSICQFG